MMAGDNWHKLRHHYLDNRSSVLDALALVAAVILTGWLVHRFDAGKVLCNLTRKCEGLELDELLLTASLSYFYLFLFAVRRYIELRRMIVKAHTDPLIGIANRTQGIEVIRCELERLAVALILITQP